MTTIATKQFDVSGDVMGGILIQDWRTDEGASWYIQPGDDAETFRRDVIEADNPEGRIDANKRMAAVDSLCAEYFV